MIALFYGHNLLGGPLKDYNPIYDWNHVRNKKGEGLLIGVYGFDSRNASFVATIPCLEVQAGLSFMVSGELLWVLLLSFCVQRR